MTNGLWRAKIPCARALPVRLLSGQVIASHVTFKSAAGEWLRFWEPFPRRGRMTRHRNWRAASPLRKSEYAGPLNNGCMGEADPFPAFAFTKARTQLRLYFGEAAVQWDEPFGDAVIHLQRPVGPPWSLRLTWRQAKYLALHPKTWTAIARGKYPNDWPM